MKLSQNDKRIIGKRMIAFLFMMCMCITITACGNNQTEGSSNTDSTSKNKASNPGNTAEPEPETSEKLEKTNTLVVYFSATGNTKRIAKKIANGLSADIYEIVAKDPYTDADLDYDDDNSRSTIEKNDASARPSIDGSVENIDQYNKIYIGYPIWWGESPKILSTFVESYDLTDKTVIPFCTSASSGIGSSAKNLEQVAGSGKWMEGKRFSGKESQDEIMVWVQGL